MAVKATHPAAIALANLYVPIARKRTELTPCGIGSRSK